MDFEELGLSVNESKSYEALIKLGKGSAPEISRNSGVPYGRIYNVLDSLISKGLVRVVPGKNKIFVPSDPKNLIEIIDGKEKKLENLRENIDKLSKFYDINEKNPVTMVFGRKGFHKIVDELSFGKKTVYNVKWTSEFNPKWVEDSKKINLRKVDKKALARYDEETKKEVRKWLKINPQMRKIDNGGVAMAIIDDKEVMIGLIKSNVTLLIKDGPFAKLMGKFFLNTYEKAEIIK